MSISSGKTKSCLKCAIDAWGSNPMNNCWLVSGSDVARSVVLGGKGAPMLGSTSCLILG